MINLGDTFDRAVLTQAGIDPDMVQAGTLNIDFIPDDGPTTIRYTAVSSVDAVALRAIIAATSAPPTVETVTEPIVEVAPDA